VTPGGLTRIVDSTAERGWVARDRPADNRREVYAVLTDPGRDLLRSASRAYSGVLQEMIGKTDVPPVGCFLAAVAVHGSGVRGPPLSHRLCRASSSGPAPAPCLAQALGRRHARAREEQLARSWVADSDDACCRSWPPHPECACGSHPPRWQRM
jgi:DNA-binding MarR family transcriptional regulator